MSHRGSLLYTQTHILRERENITESLPREMKTIMNFKTAAGDINASFWGVTI